VTGVSQFVICVLLTLSLVFAEDGIALTPHRREDRDDQRD
jgi:hypothetical protein